ncbi:secretory carrier-associated membrane protein 2 isoform X1 [Equus asinus]|uniref:secretory carrier-associated membrane protein 2 n=1 Tax=Equus quagga TaxID=89248 RepID=UPI001D03BA2A|nr:secretory carrier-associated membrane protein 2 isoform X1 [Equus asinus]XP_046506142.1 secretory carrier-associated membrane protein 2 [Equus quagga]XP_046509780.1 secretory carrier-associated membrane protein 2 [Equus quagga]
MTPPLWEGIAPALERLPSSRKSRVCPRSAAGSGCLEAEALAELAPRPPTTMSTFDTNPFADPVDVNPFQDPSVTQLTSAPQGGLAEFNPFSETNAATTVPVTQLPGPSQPAVLQPSVEPTQPSPQAVASAAQASLLRQQEELDRKAAELERKERELQNTVTNLHVRENNWPPLPSFCPIKPCFYQDFSIEIPADYQRICKMLYYLWMLHSVTLFLNLLACLAWFLVDNTKGVDFGLSILWFVMFTPCAFLCWYRPIYKAFRSDNSFSFFVFFFVFFCQIVIYVIQLVGIPNLGDSGWIAAVSTLQPKHLALSIIMMVVAGFFTLCAVLSVFLLKRVHSLYRRTGASFQQAQEEFSQGIFSNRTFRSAASSAARGAFQGN